MSIALPTTAAVQTAIDAITALHGPQADDLRALALAWKEGDLAAIDALTDATATRWERIRLAYGALHDLYPGRMAPTSIVAPLVAAYYTDLDGTPDVGELPELAARPKRVRRAA